MVREESRAAEQAVEGLQTRVAELELETDGFYARLHSSESLGRELATQLDRARSQERGLREQVEARDGEVAHLEDVKIDLEARVGLLQSEVGSLKNDVETVARDRDAVAKELAETTERLARALRGQHKEKKGLLACFGLGDVSF